MRMIFLHFLLLLFVGDKLVTFNKVQAIDTSAFLFTPVSQDASFSSIQPQNVHFGPGTSPSTIHIWAYDTSSTTITILRSTLTIANNSKSTYTLTGANTTSISTTIPSSTYSQMVVSIGAGYFAMAYQITKDLWLTTASETSDTSTTIQITDSTGTLYSIPNYATQTFTTGLMYFDDGFFGASTLSMFYDSFDTSTAGAGPPVTSGTQYLWTIIINPVNTSANYPSPRTLTNKADYSIPFFYAQQYAYNQLVLRKDGALIKFFNSGSSTSDKLVRGDGLGFSSYPAGYFSLKSYFTGGYSTSYGYGLTVSDLSGIVSLMLYFQDFNTYTIKGWNITTCACSTCCYVNKGWVYGNYPVLITFEIVQHNPSSNMMTYSLVTYNGTNITDTIDTLLTTGFVGGSSLQNGHDLFISTDNSTVWFGYTTKDGQCYLIRLSDYYFYKALYSDVLRSSITFIYFTYFFVAILMM